MNAHALDERIFYREPWRTEAEARIASIQMEGNAQAPRARIKLDATIFYPEGGGQPPDAGFIGDAAVVDVRELDGDVWHFVEAEAARELTEGAPVDIRIDAKRRLYHTQQHTGQHLLSAVLEQDYGIHTLSFHLGAEYCTIDVSAKDPSDLALGEVEAKVEGWIARDVPVRVHYCPPENVASFRLRKRPPVDEPVIRVVEIDGYDWSPCGGTHVERTGQIRALKILSVERYKGNLRVYFAAGAHAVEVLSSAYEEAREAALLLSSGVENLSSRVRESIEKSSQLERRLKKCAQQSAETSAALAAAKSADGSMIAFVLDDEDAERAAALVKASTALGRAAVAISVPDCTVVVQVPGDRGIPSLAASLKEPMSGLGGKGGGGPTFFRASFSSADSARQFWAAARDFLEKMGAGR